MRDVARTLRSVSNNFIFPVRNKQTRLHIIIKVLKNLKRVGNTMKQLLGTSYYSRFMGTCSTICCKPVISDSQPIRINMQHYATDHTGAQSFPVTDAFISQGKLSLYSGDPHRKLSPAGTLAQHGYDDQHSQSQTDTMVIGAAHEQSTKFTQGFTIRTNNKLVLATIGSNERTPLPPITLDNGGVYTGQWKNGMRDGTGTQTWPDGTKYVGDWLEDRANGKGTFYHNDGDVYEGEWLNDKAHGVGTYYHNNGAKYVGEWFEDKQHGKGVETWLDGASYEGTYVLGKKSGKGILRFADGSSYKGEMIHNDIQGFGEYEWPDGRRYEGHWFKNRMHGKGKLTWPDGRIYDGHYENDKKHGEGTFIWKDGSRYIGPWKQGKQHGRGVYITANGNKRVGEWVEGKRMKWIEGANS